MNWGLVLCVVIILLLAGIIIKLTLDSPYSLGNLKYKLNVKRFSKEYVSAENLLTYAERGFYKRLKHQCDNRDLEICCKTRLEDIINAQKCLGKNKYQLRRARVKSKHVDFLVLDRDMNIMFAIELDDSSHNKKDAKEKDRLKDCLFESVGIPLHHVKLGVNYDNAIHSILQNY